jgi:hypothetical protein
VFLQLGEIVERIGAAQFRGVDQAHEQIAHAGSILRLIEQGVLAVQDGFLQCSFANGMPTARLCRVGSLGMLPSSVHVGKTRHNS